MGQSAAQVTINLLRFRLLEGVRHGVSTRHGGTSAPPFESLNLGYSTPDDEDNVAENRARFMRSIGATPETLVTGHLTHGTEVAVFEDGVPDRWPRVRYPVRAGSVRSAWMFDADSAVSNVPGLTLFITAADCTPLLLWDQERHVVGAAHAGWRGTAGGIAGNVVRAMTDTFGSRPADLVAGIGPAIGPCCYTVGAEVLDTFCRAGLEPVVRAHDGAVRLDLWESNRRQLLAAGLPPESIEAAGLCTACHVSTFFSHRAERGRTGRMAGAIGL